ncbi:MAG TPA: Gfo/Idh/MocA family oxidoreductase [Roseiflexaceae bacterium]|nr:Gfo/Idh/MocA family oxidoreductase [Roseiflexaceae bacterium]HMP43047.1 Gfo/Idh/MocA family oxidoreductase [Roseiflexaceae bacterium]
MPHELTVAIVGCGNISGPYAETLKPYEHIHLRGAADVDPERARQFVAKHGGIAYASLDEVLADEAVDLVINLTIHHAHPEVITRCLNAGKHVHSEKPLAMTNAEAQALVKLAEARGLRLSCAPITYMGEAQQTTWKLIRDGRLGDVRVVYAEVNWGRIESWHPNPGPFYDVGALFDVGVYPLTLVTTMFGPARRATAFGKVLYPDRVTQEGTPFHITTPDFVVAAVELANGTVVRLTTNFYVNFFSRQRGLEFHGDRGSVYLGSFQDFDTSVEFAEFGKEYTPVEHVRPAYPGTEWSRAVVEMAEAIGAGRPQRATGAQAAHVVEICCAISESLQNGRPVEITSSFPQPDPMDWAR